VPPLNSISYLSLHSEILLSEIMKRRGVTASRVGESYLVECTVGLEAARKETNGTLWRDWCYLSKPGFFLIHWH